MKLISLIIPFTIALSTGCATKVDPCGDGMARADDGNCYPYEGIIDTGSTNQLPDADGGTDADGGPPPDDGGTDADGGPPPDDGGTDADSGPPPDDGGEDPPPDDGATPPDDPPADEGPSGCSSDADCVGECFGEGTGCVCDEGIEICVPSCDTDDDCPGGMTCSGGVCEP